MTAPTTHTGQRTTHTAGVNALPPTKKRKRRKRKPMPRPPKRSY